MLTVKHRHDDGTETLYEAATVSRVCDGEASCPPCGDVVLRGCPGDGFNTGPGAVSGPGCEIRIGAGSRSANGMDPRVFVMNRFGATVADYRL